MTWPADARRRVRLALARAASTLPGCGLRRRCVFVHLPKCGGTSLASGLYGTVPLSRRIGVIDAVATRRAAALVHFDRDDPRLCHEDLPRGHLTFALRESLLLTHMAWGTALIHGHVLVSDRMLALAGKDYGLVTMMRDPVARALSNYRMAVRAGVIADDLDAWLDGPVGWSMAQVYLRYLSGVNAIAPPAAPMALRVALDRLERFSIIGFLDAPKLFRDRFAALFGPRPALLRQNRATGPEPRLSAPQRGRLLELAAPDLEIYDRAQRLFRATAP